LAQAKNKTQPTKASVKDFLAAVENERRRKDGETLLKLMQKVTGKKPVMWGPSIIGFDQVHYKYESGREGDICRIGFSPRKASLSLYIPTGFANADKLKKKLGKVKSAVGCMYINKLDDVDMNVLEQLIREGYEYSLANNRMC
jgi:hypothetical protein